MGANLLDEALALSIHAPEQQSQIHFAARFAPAIDAVNASHSETAEVGSYCQSLSAQTCEIRSMVRGAAARVQLQFGTQTRNAHC